MLKNVMNVIKKYKKYIIIGVIILILAVVGYFVYNYVQDRIYEKNKSNYPKEEQISKDIEKSIIKEIDTMTINGEKINHQFNIDNIKNIEYKEGTDPALTITLYYHLEDIVSLDIPFEAYYSFNGKNYNFTGLFNPVDEGADYENVKIVSCENLKNSYGETSLDIVNKKYKEKYDSVNLIETKAENDESCISTYEAKSDKEYINKNSKITVKNNLVYSTMSKEFTISTQDNEEVSTTFNLVGKYTGNHVTRGYFHDKSSVNFEITEVKDNTAILGSSGKIIEGSMYYALVAEDAYIEPTDYDYYILNVGYKYGKDASGVDRDLTVRIYDDKLLYYCPYSDKRTDECYTMNKN